MTPRRLPFLPLTLLLMAPAAAQAQTPPVPAPPAPPAPAPAAGKASVKAYGGLPSKAVRYYAPKQQVVLKGRVRPAVPGEALTLTTIRRGKAVSTLQKPVRAGGRYAFRLKISKPGTIRLVVRHAASAGQVAFRAKSLRIHVVRWSSGYGANGLKVVLLQRGLKRLGYATPVDGSFGSLTANAVNAFRKTNGLGNADSATRAVYARILRRRGAYKLRYPKAGKHVEFDWSRQVVVLASKGRPYRVIDTSSGKASTPTVLGTYRFYLKTPGTNGSGMVHSNYFIGGYAIHGYPSVPNYPASHGCLRIPIPLAAAVFRWIDIGDRILLYR